MQNINETQKRLAIMGNASYRYECLIVGFAEQYLELKKLNYEIIPDIVPFHQWLYLLYKKLRPELRELQEKIAEIYKFNIGDHIKIDDTELYVFRISCYLLEDKLRFEGFSVKKDGKPSQTATAIEVKPTSNVEALKGRLSEEEINKYMFPNVSRLENVKAFINEEKKKMA